MIGKSVWTKSGNHNLRIGKVTEEKTENNWSFVKVAWINDEAFEQDRRRVIELRGYDKYSDWYRIDKISFFDKDDLINTINKL
jgi:hypothetical protein|tara:strand:+ start:394 stop:642 length:249 start_codon:yes stop_codon:yes gene_type:complete